MKNPIGWTSLIAVCFLNGRWVGYCIYVTVNLIPPSQFHPSRSKFHFVSTTQYGSIKAIQDLTLATPPTVRLYALVPTVNDAGALL